MYSVNVTIWPFKNKILAIVFKVNVIIIVWIYFNSCPVGVAQWTSPPPQDQKPRVRIPPGYTAFRAT
jgi:hypothetical protein